MSEAKISHILNLTTQYVYQGNTKILFYKTTQGKNMTAITGINMKCIHRENEKTRCDIDYESAIMDIVDESLSSFGNSFRQVIYFQLENTFHIKKQEIPFRIHEFAAAIEELFGVGAKLIEIRIVKALHDRFEGFIYFPEMENLVFAEYVEGLRCFLRFSS
jgi:hypothetical protein